jgi:hypothetical protein
LIERNGAQGRRFELSEKPGATTANVRFGSKGDVTAYSAMSALPLKADMQRAAQ